MGLPRPTGASPLEHLPLSTGRIRYWFPFGDFSLFLDIDIQKKDYYLFIFFALKRDVDTLVLTGSAEFHLGLLLTVDPEAGCLATNHIRPLLSNVLLFCSEPLVRMLL